MVTGADFWTSEDGSELAKDYWTVARSAMFRKALSDLESVAGNRGRLVDIGGGVGHFAELALELGWDAYSADISASARREAAKRLGPERSLSPEAAGELAGTCDVVTLWCVIAHVTDPALLLEEAAALLRPGGVLLVTTPNFIFQGSLARLLARLNRHYDLVCRDHVLHFTPGAARKLLRRSGMTSIEFRYFGVTDNCFLVPGLGRMLVPVKRLWNLAGSAIARFGIPPLCSELQIIAVKGAG